MITTVTTSWLVLALAIVLLGDVVLSIKPVAFIGQCLESVEFPRRYWWVFLVIKTLAAAGLILGLWIPNLALAAAVGTVSYFVCATIAHLRASAYGVAFAGCLGMLLLSILVLVFGVG